ncbi:hypothetical protein OSB04_004426 [Centaurea solstitialis]|uniref:Uncharacterized protein n=1 Tax=Centaurea solstitialis TaxID=347529 RepID=A0AA38WUB0_9ASTR|nr:hypothetical protein OSB04_004426 [Centaurea solstitialis]
MPTKHLLSCQDHLLENESLQTFFLLHISCFCFCNFIKINICIYFLLYSRTKMSKSPHKYEYDPHLEFAQFLKEAKTHACQQESLHVTGKDQLSGATKLNNKSWKSSIFSWLKANKKKSSHKKVIQEEPPPPSKSSPKIRPSYVSGPINRISADRPKRPTSGPLISTLFKTKEEFQRPYISLGKINNSRDVNPYGPIYMVT